MTATRTEAAQPRLSTSAAPANEERDGAGLMEIIIPSGIVARFLFIAWITLVTLDIVLQSFEMTIAPDIPGWTQLMKFFDLDRENAIATWYSIMLLAATSLTLGFIAWVARKHRDPMWHYWLALSVMFFAFSIDEQILGHESVGAKVDNFVGGEGLFLYAWVLPAIGAVAIAALLFIPFARSLRPSLRLRLLIAAGLYVGGALVMEMVSGVVAEHSGLRSLTYETTTSIEETLEIAGVSYFLFLVLTEAGRRASSVTLRVE